MKLPASVIETLESQLSDLSYGSVVLEVIIHDNAAKYRVIKTVSIVPNRPTSGEARKTEQNS